METVGGDGVPQTNSDPELNQMLKEATITNPRDLKALKRHGKLKPSQLTNEERYKLCLSIGECVKPEELEELLKHRVHPVCYDGFEPSGRMHIAQGVMKAINVNKLTQSGCVFIFWIADFYALLNGKLGSNLKKIQKMGQYFIEVWKAVGMDMSNVRFIWASDEITTNATDYMLRFINISTEFNITRIKRCSQIMGRTEGDDQPASQIIYPCMQCSDIFQLEADICQLGLDQRKVNMLAREYCVKKGIKNVPVILSHPMLPSLTSADEKMSKSNPDSAIFMEDDEPTINRKIKKAFCPPEQIENNPCITYIETMIFPMLNKFELFRSEKNGGNMTFNSLEELKSHYSEGKLHPSDLKTSLSKALNKIIEPVRQHFANDPEAKQLLKEITSYQITR